MGVDVNFMVKVCNYERMNVERLGARLFTGIGGVLWALAAGSAAIYWNNAPSHGVGEALVLAATSAVVLAVGWFFERVAAILVFIAAIAAIVYGVVQGWELGVFVTVSLFVIVPMIMAGLLYLSAAETQSVCRLEE